MTEVHALADSDVIHSRHDKAIVNAENLFILFGFGLLRGFSLGCYLGQSHLASFLHEQLHEWFALVGHAVVEYGVFQRLLQLADLARGF